MNLFDIWLYGIIPAFFIFGVVAFSHKDAEHISLFKLTMAAIIWPFSMAVGICVFIGAMLKS